MTDVDTILDPELVRSLDPTQRRDFLAKVVAELFPDATRLFAVIAFEPNSDTAKQAASDAMRKLIAQGASPGERHKAGEASRNNDYAITLYDGESKFAIASTIEQALTAFTVRHRAELLHEQELRRMPSANDPGKPS